MKFDRLETRIVAENAAQSVENLRGSGRTMMMNEPVAIGGSNDVARAMSVDELRVRLHRKLKRIARARGYLDLQEAEALREAQKVQLWKHFGHASLVDYMVNELGYTSWRTAEDRLRLANALPDLPKLTEAIQTGELNMSQARELARVVTPETEEEWIAKSLDLNVRQVEQAVAGHAKGDLPEDPIDPRLVRKNMFLSVRPETEILFREARKALEAERGERLDDDCVLEALCRSILRPGTARARSSPAAYSTHVGAELSTSAIEADSAAPAAKTETTAVAAVAAGDTVSTESGAHASTHVGAAYRVAVTVCGQCKRGWQHGARAVVEMSPAAVERATCDAQWLGDLDSRPSSVHDRKSPRRHGATCFIAIRTAAGCRAARATGTWTFTTSSTACTAARTSSRI